MSSVPCSELIRHSFTSCFGEDGPSEKCLQRAKITGFVVSLLVLTLAVIALCVSLNGGSAAAGFEHLARLGIAGSSCVLAISFGASCYFGFLVIRPYFKSETSNTLSLGSDTFTNDSFSSTSTTSTTVIGNSKNNKGKEEDKRDTDFDIDDMPPLPTIPAFILSEPSVGTPEDSSVGATQTTTLSSSSQQQQPDSLAPPPLIKADSIVGTTNPFAPPPPPPQEELTLPKQETPPPPPRTSPSNSPQSKISNENVLGEEELDEDDPIFKSFVKGSITTLPEKDGVTPEG